MSGPRRISQVLLLFVVLALVNAATCYAQPYLIGTIAGGGLPVTPATATNVSLGYSPQGVAVDANGNVYFTASNCVFKVDTSGTLTRIAGVSSIAGYSGDGGPAGAAQFSFPQGIAVDASGNLYVADTGNQRVRKIAAGGGIVITVAGNGTAGFSGDGAAAAAAQLNRPTGVAVDSAGNLYIADSFNQRIRWVTAAGLMLTLAGNGVPSYATLNGPTGVSVDGSGNVYIAEVGNSRISKVSPAGKTLASFITVAGDGTYGFSGDGGPASAAALNAPAGVATDAAGNLYIADTGNSAIRKVATDGTITTVAGPTFSNALTADPPYGDGGLATKAVLGSPSAVAVDGHGNFFIADTVLARIRKVAGATGIISTIAGGGNLRYIADGGPATSAQVSIISLGSGITVDSGGNLYFQDGAAIRRVAAGTGIISTVASANGPVSGFNLYNAFGLAVDPAGNLYIADFYNNAVRRVAAGSNIVTTYAGNGVKGYSGDGGPALNAEFDLVAGVALDSAGNLYIADMANARIRKVAATGIITTVAGNGVVGYGGDGGPATAASLNQPDAIAVDSAGNLFIADSNNQMIRKVDARTGILTRVAGNGTAGYAGDGGPATNAQLSVPQSVAVDAAGNLYILSATNVGTNWALRKVTAATGIISTIAGGTTNVGFEYPAGVAVGRNGQVYVADRGNNVVYEINDSGAPAAERPTTGQLTFDLHVQNVQPPPSLPSATATTPPPGNPLTIGGTVQFTQSLAADLLFPGGSFVVQTSVPPQWTITACSSDPYGGCMPAGGNSISLIYPAFPTGLTPTYTLTADGPAANFLAVNSTSSTGAAVAQILNVLPSAVPVLSFQPTTPTIAPGLQIYYWVTITNTGGAKLAGDPLTVTITPDPSITLQEGVPGPGASWTCIPQAANLICTDSADLPAGGTTILTVSGAVSLLASGSVTSSATLAFGGQVTAPISATAAVVTTRPQAVTPISPAPGATLVSATSSLSWTAAAGANAYAVHFGTSTPPPVIASVSSTTYALVMAPNTTYYWSVTAVNALGSTPSPVWSFTTNPCEYTVSPGSVSLTAQGTSSPETCPTRFSGETPTECGVLPEAFISFTVTATAACGPWNATSSNPLALQILSGASGTGSGSVSFVLLNNTHITARNYSISVGNTTTSAIYSVTQAGSGDFQSYREVYALYQQILGRDPDAAGFAYWTGDGANSLGIMADNFIVSPEALNSDFAVMAVYQAATGGPPTYSQFVSAKAAVRAGRQSIPGLFSSLTPSGFSAFTLYQNLLNRQPGAGDSNCIASGLAACFQTVIGYPFAYSSFNNEFQSTGNYHTTLAADHTNALYVRMLYYVILGRDPDTAGYNFWLGVANTGGPGLLFIYYPTDYTTSQIRLQILGAGFIAGAGFTGSPEFQGLFVN